MRIVIAPDSFKGTATATQAAEAIAEGWRSVRPDDDVRTIPLADGGEGTIDALAAADPVAVRVPVNVAGPLGRRLLSSYLLKRDSTAVVELASTSGYALADRSAPLETHTLGFGEAIRAALKTDVPRVLLALGGSCSTDGGAGMLTALGARLLDSEGQQIPPGNAGLARLERIELDDLVPLPEAGVVALTDVTNPLLGKEGAVSVFGPQKGITPDLAPAAEANLARFAELVASATGVSPAHPGTGAAGGAGFGVLVWGGRLAAGAPAIADHVRFGERVAGADLVITGEGRYDAQTASGKLPQFVASTAAQAGARAALVAGSVDADPAGFADSASLTDLAGSAEAAMSDPVRWLREAGAALASRLDGSREAQDAV